MSLLSVTTEQTCCLYFPFSLYQLVWRASEGRNAAATNAYSLQMNRTAPIDTESPKRRLVWSPHVATPWLLSSPPKTAAWILTYLKTLSRFAPAAFLVSDFTLGRLVTLRRNSRVEKSILWGLELNQTSYGHVTQHARPRRCLWGRFPCSPRPLVSLILLFFSFRSRVQFSCWCGGLKQQVSVCSTGMPAMRAIEEGDGTEGGWKKNKKEPAVCEEDTSAFPTSIAAISREPAALTVTQRGSILTQRLNVHFPQGPTGGSWARPWTPA